MKEYKLNLENNKDIIIQVPDDLEVDRDELFAMASIEMQEQIVNGNVKVSVRIWPCMYCGEKYSKQSKLQKHLHTHDELKGKLKDKIKYLYESKDSGVSKEKSNNQTDITLNNI